MFGSEKSSSLRRDRGTNSDQSNIPLLGNDKKIDDNQCERMFVKIKSGDTSEMEVDISEAETVDDLKIKLISLLKITGKRIRLIASGRMLEPGYKYLQSDFNVKSGAFIHVVVSENVAHPTVSGSASAQSVPNATIYRGLDQMNAGERSHGQISPHRMRRILTNATLFSVQVERLVGKNRLVHVMPSHR